MGEKRIYVSAKDTYLGMERHNFTRFWFTFTHFFGFYGLYLVLTGQVPWSAIAYSLFHGYFIAGLGLTVAGHRYWAHKSFKAKPFLRLVLIYMHTAAGQLSVFEYVRFHRPHHKWADTDSDPHNAQRGFWHSQILWTMRKELPEVKEKRDSMNFSDVDSDPLVRFQSKYYWPLVVLTMFLVPMSCYYYLWGKAEDGRGPSFLTLLSVNLAQYVLGTHFAFLANSITHIIGDRPYNKGMFPRENWLTAMFTFGEGFHNFHHVFPWDYKISEGGFGPFNLSTGFIDLCAKLGLAYDLRTSSQSMIEYKTKKLGDGTHPLYGHSHKDEKEEVCESVEEKLPSWGLEDEDSPPEDLKLLTVLHKKAKAA